MDDGWGDEGDDDDEGWGDDDDMDEDPFASIGAKTVSAPATARSKSAGGNDPFASFGMSATVKPKSSGGKLVLPKKTNLATKKVAAPPATKLAMDDDDVADGWDDF